MLALSALLLLAPAQGEALSYLVYFQQATSPVEVPALAQGYIRFANGIIGALMPLAGRVEMNVLSRLRSRKVIATGEARNLVLRKLTRHAILDAAPLRQTKDRLTRMLMGEELPNPRDVCLMTLVKTCGLLEEVIPKAGSA
jgi:hypothetical protein